MIRGLVVAGADLHPTVSVGTSRRGAQIFARRVETDQDVYVRNPDACWGGPEIQEVLRRAAQGVRQAHPGGERLVVGDASRRNGGRFRPHYTHQLGRDVDMRYFLTGGTIGDYEYRPVTRANMDLPRNWTLIASFASLKSVDRILMDYRHQRSLWRYARSIGISKVALERVFSYPRGRAVKGALIQHARGHWNHLHVRVRGTAARRLGQSWNIRQIRKMQRRYDRFLGRVLKHLVIEGDSLLGIARRYRVPLDELKRLNRRFDKQPLLPGDVVQLRRP